MKRELPCSGIFLYRGIGGVSLSAGYRWPPITADVVATPVANGLYEDILGSYSINTHNSTRYYLRLGSAINHA
jgi:hypothetical protein